MLRGCQSRARRLLLAIALLGASAAAAADVDLSAPAAVAQLERSRALKDSLFRHGEESPLRPEDVAGFAGLRYFPVDPSWRVEGQFHRYGRARRVRIPDTSGTTIAVERFGRFVFSHGGKPFWLEAFRSLQGGDVTVYFTDATNGTQTYGAGRYAAVEASEDGSHVVDFNGAYSPYCAYNPAYVCPLPPAHNRLPFAVTAGEMNAGPELAH